jgi:uncharacterized protein (TIGR00369 family)
MEGQWEPRNPDYRATVHRVFAEQRAMALIGARLSQVRPGFVEIRLSHREEVTQQHGAIHGGVVGMAVDSACAFAALSLLPSQETGFTIEYKINFLAPAMGDEIVARGWVVRVGRTLAVARGEAHVLAGGEEQLVATALETLLHFPARTADGGRAG